ncbi:hypothetical protein [Burkholderia sp. S171]|uniref:hypothetical protein n=1 Tax=Burkholderia sp. S171 TaxID=1641860 RepID=UPI00131E8D06|nr:hypothetical protein [Burkholderia sp. S171]
MSPELRPVKYVATAALWLVSGLTTFNAAGQAGGQPLILDTQAGIHSGAGGTVLQTGPLTGSGIVPARPTATLPELPQQDQQTIIVSPYIDLQQGGNRAGQGYGAATGSQPSSSNYQHRPRTSSPHSGASYGVPTGTQTQAPTSMQPAVPQARQSPGQPPIITPIPIATPRSIATPSPAPTVPTRSSDRHTVTGVVSTSLD